VIKHGRLSNRAEIQRWINDSNQYRPSQNVKFKFLRPLACEQTSWDPFRFGVSISATTFDLLKTKFHLSNMTLHAFSNYGGTCYKVCLLQQEAVLRRGLVSSSDHDVTISGC